MVTHLRKQHPRLGARKLHHMLKPYRVKTGIKLGRDAFFNLLATHSLLIRHRKRRKQPTYSKHWFRKYPNQIRDLVVRDINKVWVSDITYWHIGNKFLYLSFITDAYSHKIVGYSVSTNLEAVNNLGSLHMALRENSCSGSLSGLIHHSDRGIQYCSKEYIAMLNTHNIQISMSEHGDPLENALAERINGIMKHEYLLRHQVKNLKQAKGLVDKVVKLYNEKRPHLSCGLHTPSMIHSHQDKPIRLWKNYKKTTSDNLC